MESEGFVVICPDCRENLREFTQFVLDTIPRKELELKTSSDEETREVLPWFEESMRKVGGVEERLGGRKQGEREEEYRKRVLTGIREVQGCVVLITRQVWREISAGELMSSVVVQIQGNTAEELADLPTLTRHLPPSNLLTSIDILLNSADIPPEHRHFHVKSAIEIALNTLKTHYEDQIHTIKREFEEIIDLYKTQIESLQKNSILIADLMKEIAFLRKKCDFLYEKLPNLQVKLPPIDIKTEFLPSELVVNIQNNKIFPMNNLILALKSGKNRSISNKYPLNILPGANFRLKIDRNPLITPIFLAIFQGNRQISEEISVEIPDNAIDGKFGRVKETLKEGWTLQLESYLATLRADPRASTWSESDLIDLLFNLHSPS